MSLDTNQKNEPINVLNDLRSQVRKLEQAQQALNNQI